MRWRHDLSSSPEKCGLDKMSFYSYSTSNPLQKTLVSLLTKLPHASLLHPLKHVGRLLLVQSSTRIRKHRLAFLSGGIFCYRSFVVRFHFYNLKLRTSYYVRTKYRNDRVPLKAERFCLSGVGDLRRPRQLVGLWPARGRARQQHQKELVELARLRARRYRGSGL